MVLSRGIDVITALNEKAFVVNEPALIVGLLDDLTQPGAGDRRIHQAVFIPQCHANGIQVGFSGTDGPPQFAFGMGSVSCTEWAPLSRVTGKSARKRCR